MEEVMMLQKLIDLNLAEITGESIENANKLVDKLAEDPSIWNEYVDLMKLVNVGLAYATLEKIRDES